MMVLPPVHQKKTPKLRIRQKQKSLPQTKMLMRKRRLKLRLIIPPLKLLAMLQMVRQNLLKLKLIVRQSLLKLRQMIRGRTVKRLVMMQKKAEPLMPKAIDIPLPRRTFSKGMLKGLAAMIMPGMLAGCERFRHEKYTCPSNSIGLLEVIINDDRAGAAASVSEVTRDYTLTIGSITSDEVIMANDEMVMIINRNTGYMQVTVGTIASYIRCEKSLFTM